MYATGSGVTQDLREAASWLEWFRKSASARFPPATGTVRGSEVPRDLPLAVDYASRAADKNNEEAMWWIYSLP
jgi:TPR repeat protein